MTLAVKMKPMPRGAKRTTLRTVLPANSWRALGATDLELRRWCIEQAIKWPTEYRNSGAAGTYPYGGASTTHDEADVIGRATKLLNWVTDAK